MAGDAPLANGINHFIVALAHVNLNVSEGSLALAEEFYGEILGLKSIPVPEAQRECLRWFEISPTGQQVHISLGTEAVILAQPSAERHPCFKVASLDALQGLQQRMYDHHLSGSKAAAIEVDKVGERDSGSQGKEYPKRFFARDYAGNRLEFSLSGMSEPN